MNKLTFLAGIILGAGVTFYSIPYFEKENGPLKRPGIAHLKFYSIKDPYVLDDDKEKLFAYLKSALGKLPKSMPDQEITSSTARDIIKTIADKDIEMAHFIDGYLTSHKHVNNEGLTNKDFKAIMSRYAKKEDL